ncbi:hypothetical protein [Streptomyces globisporus]|uniref:hypothetical protein n=1 Tax=Streptomyces globisporus TaxID=1908 RepID=UPI0037FB6B9F
MTDEAKTLPDDFEMTMSVTLTTAEFRELMRSAAYRAAKSSGKLAELLNAGVTKLGDAWNAATEDQDAPHALCSRCGRDVPRRFLAKLIEKQGGGLACSPLDPENQAECQRITTGGQP